MEPHSGCAVGCDVYLPRRNDLPVAVPDHYAGPSVRLVQADVLFRHPAAIRGSWSASGQHSLRRLRRLRGARVPTSHRLVSRDRAAALRRAWRTSRSRPHRTAGDRLHPAFLRCQRSASRRPFLDHRMGAGQHSAGTAVGRHDARRIALCRCRILDQLGPVGGGPHSVRAAALVTAAAGVRRRAARSGDGSEALSRIHSRPTSPALPAIAADGGLRGDVHHLPAQLPS